MENMNSSYDCYDKKFDIIFNVKKILMPDWDSLTLPANADKAFNYLCENYDELSFADFEEVFYLIIYNMFNSLRINGDNSVNIPEEFVSDEAVPDKAKNEYLKAVYALAKAQFDKFFEITKKPLNDNNTHIFPVFYYLKTDLWERVKLHAENALKNLPIGEIALRFSFIADIILMFNRTVFKETEYDDDYENSAMSNQYGRWAIGKTEDNYEICDYSIFYRYREVRENNSTGFFSDCFHNPNTDDEFPYLKESTYYYLKDEYYLIDEKDRKDETKFNERLFNHLFGMPAYVDVNHKAFITSVELQKTNEELEKAKEEKNTVINDFTHTYGNMQATTLSDIANALIGLKHDYFKDLGRKLLVEFSIKENLTKEVDMLKLRFTDKVSELVNIIRENSGSSCKEPVGISDVISGALSRCFYTLFYSMKKLGDTLRKSVFENDENIYGWRNSFEDEVLVGSTNALDWNNNHGFIPLELRISNFWEKLLVANNEYAYLYLVEIFSELFINLLKYGSIEEDTPVELVLGENGDTITITMKNKKSVNYIGYGTGKGLEVKKNLTSKINGYFNIKDEPMIITETEDCFTVLLSISRKLFNM